MIASETYKMLWKEVIEDLLAQICDNNINYCVRVNGKEEIHVEVGRKFDEYRNRALKNMLGDRLDRHKLASCICGAIIEVQPLVGYKGAVIRKNANELLAMYVGLNVIKLYMMFELMEKESGFSKDILTYLKETFDMKSPSMDENICDTRDYKENMANALYRSHHECEEANKTCHHFDIWAYSNIFYHLELYNKNRLNDFYLKYKNRTVAKVD